MRGKGEAEVCWWHRHVSTPAHLPRQPGSRTANPNSTRRRHPQAPSPPHLHRGGALCRVSRQQQI